MHPDPTQHARRSTGPTRRASAYVLLLAVSLLVLVIGAGSIAASRAGSHAAESLGDMQGAFLNAASGVELGRLWIAQDPNWRSKRSNGVWATAQPIGNGTFTLDVTNPNGAMNRSATDPVVMTATGEVRKARHKVQVTLTPTVNTFSSLQCAAFAGGNMTLTSATVNASGQFLGANGGILAALSTINAHAEAGLTAAGLTFNGLVKSLCPVRRVPDASVFDYYQSIGNTISIGSIPTAGPNKVITKCVLSPTTNPFGGGTSSSSVYVIDCSGQNLVISNCRIVGTLLILNPGAGSSIQGSVNWTPAVGNYPCLLVKGSMAITTSGAALAENGTDKVTYNPSGTSYPYPGGAFNATYTDSFPCIFDGLVYVSANATTGTNVTVKTLIVGGSLSTGGILTLTYDPAILDNPPPGFATATVSPVPGTWKQVVN